MTSQTETAGGWFNDRDEKHVGFWRRVIAFHDRWGLRFLVLCVMTAVLLLGSMIWLGFKLDEMLKGPAFQGVFAGMAIGLWLGTAAGIAIFELVKIPLEMLFGHRNERLMLRYHDALRDLVSRLAEDADSFRNRDAKE